MDLNDRSIISNRTIVEKIGEMWEIENGRISSEEMSREAGDTPPKYSQYIQSYVPEENHDKQMELKETSVPKSPYTNTDEEGKDSGLNQGRPPGSKDSFKRKRTIKTVAELIVVGERIQDKLDKICDADYLKEKGIKNKRMLTSDQRQELEDIKLGVMSIVKDDKFSSVRGLTGHINEDFIRVYTDMVKQVGSDLTHSEYRAIKSSAFAQVNGQSPVEENQVQ
jgi:hypothetical protein